MAVSPLASEAREAAMDASVGRADAPPVPIRGSAQIYPIFGCPVDQVQAPRFLNRLFARAGVDAVMVPVEVAPEDYPALLRAMLRAHNIPGALVTIPHKVATLEVLDTYSDTVRIAGSCNAVARRADGSLHGELFDGVGFVRALAKQGFVVRDARCLVIGAGGAGAAIAAALLTEGAQALRVYDTRRAHAHSIAARLHGHFPGREVDAGGPSPAGFDLVVNATPLGMSPDDPLPIDVRQLTASITVGEIVMKRAVTGLVAAAQARGCRVVFGLDMLIEQLPLYLDFFGLPALAHEPAAQDGAEPAPQATGPVLASPRDALPTPRPGGLP
jgi:shikimate dehydrogenase